MTTADTFDVTCGCGEVIHTSVQHLGRTIRCRCGRAVTIARPAGNPAEAKGRSRSSTSRSSSTSSPKSSNSKARGRAVMSRVTGAARSFVRGVAHELMHPRPVTRWAARLQAAYLVGVLATWLALITLSESWLPATLLAYGPRAVVLLPALLLVPFGLFAARLSLSWSALALVVALMPIMGFRLGLPPGAAAERVPGAIRVVSLNAQGGGLVTARLDQLLALGADIVHVQECSDVLAAALRQRGGYEVAQYRNLCTASRWPITAVDSMPRQAFASVSRLGFGGTALVFRTIVAHPGQPFQTVNLHLETPRKGLEAVVSDEGLLPDDGSLPTRLPIDPSATAGLDINAVIRDRESERAAGWAARQSVGLPLVVAGDFNMPVESTIYRRHWAGYANAFDEHGLGFGYTKIEGRLVRARIDHVLTLPGTFTVAKVLVGPDLGSDHRPVVADLRLP